ncbi:MAG: YlbF family regulator [Clostridia bacterium]|nr:YlbF family regulator [Clostridia bacterium]
MDVVELTRQLGVAIQADERYTKFTESQEKAMSDEEVRALNDRLENLRERYETEAQKPNPDQVVLGNLDTTFQKTYGDMMNVPSMVDYVLARRELDNLMKYLTEILYLTVNGEDPLTCEPAPQGGCGCGCSPEDCNCEGGECGPDCGCDCGC